MPTIGYTSYLSYVRNFEMYLRSVAVLGWWVTARPAQTNFFLFVYYKKNTEKNLVVYTVSSESGLENLRNRP